MARLLWTVLAIPTFGTYGLVTPARAARNHLSYLIPMARMIPPGQASPAVGMAGMNALATASVPPDHENLAPAPAAPGSIGPSGWVAAAGPRPRAGGTTPACPTASTALIARIMPG